MKILALGGCGSMGKIAVQTTIALDPTTEIVVADRDFEAAKRFTDNFSDNVYPAQLDAFDSAALDNLMVSCDIVLSTIGPFYLFGSLVLEAAIRTKTHYLDICDDPEPTLAMLQLHKQAEMAGITAIVGAGASPGVSNLFAAKAIAALKTPDEVYTLWGDGGAVDEGEGDLELRDENGLPSAATVHWLEQLSGSVKVLENGELVPTKPLREVSIDFPGVGSDLCHICGHPEPITLGRYYPTIRRSYNLMNMPSYIIYALKKSVKNVRDGNHDDVKAAAEKLSNMMSEGDMGVLDTARYMYHLEKDKKRTFLPSLAAIAIGTDTAGQRTTVGVHIEAEYKVGDMAHQTCIPTAIILKMISDGDILKYGVFAPEACIDPDIFFPRILPYLNINDGFDETNFLQVTKFYHPIPEAIS
ncbi:MAG: lysine 6-dehydrogenase [Porticoccaceae bacterium]|jgi:lysine 6-dehydrogenase